MTLPKSLTTVTTFSKTLALVLAIGTSAAAFMFGEYYQSQLQSARPVPSNYDECASLGYPILLSYPAQCVAGGVTFRQDVATKSASPTK